MLLNQFDIYKKNTTDQLLILEHGGKCEIYQHPDANNESGKHWKDSSKGKAWAQRGKQVLPWDKTLDGNDWNEPEKKQNNKRGICHCFTLNNTIDCQRLSTLASSQSQLGTKLEYISLNTSSFFFYIYAHFKNLLIIIRVIQK